MHNVNHATAQSTGFEKSSNSMLLGNGSTDMQKGSCKALPNLVKLNEEDLSYGHEVMMTISLPSDLMNKVFNAHTYPGLLV